MHRVGCIPVTSRYGKPETAEGTGFLFTADERGNMVSRVDLSAGTVTKVAVGVAPHNVQIGADGRHLLVVGAPADAAHGESHAHGGGSAFLLILNLWPSKNLRQRSRSVTTPPMW